MKYFLDEKEVTLEEVKEAYAQLVEKEDGCEIIVLDVITDETMYFRKLFYSF